MDPTRCPEVSDTEFDGHDWNALVRAYQQRPCPATSTPLLDAIEQPARHFWASLDPMPPTVDEEDIWQQFQVNLLEAAAGMVAQPAGHWTAIRLLQRAHQETWRWMSRQVRIRTRPLRPDIVGNADVLSQPLEALADVTTDPLYRKVVLGEPYELQARRLGVTATSLRQRASRRARELRAARQGGEGEVTPRDLIPMPSYQKLGAPAGSRAEV